MSKRRLVVTAVLAGQSQVRGRPRLRRLAGRVSRLLPCSRAEGGASSGPRSRAPKTTRGATPAETVELVVRLRKQLADAGLDAGADTIGWHLAHHHGTTL